MITARSLTHFLRTPSSRLVKWVEVVILSAGIPALGFLVSPEHSLLLSGGSLLPAIPPALIGLRYGISFAVPSAIGIVTATALISGSGHLSFDSLPLELTLTTLLPAVICGQFRDSWERDRTRYEVQLSYQAARIEQITHSYGIVLASHSRLEERLCGEAVSLRAALTAMRERLMVSTLMSPDVAHRFADTILDLFAEYGHVQASAVYRCVMAESAKDPESALLDRLEPLAKRGDPPALSPDNPLLCQALSSVKTAVAAPHQLVVTEGLEAITPIRRPNGGVWGVVCVSEMGAVDYGHRTISLMTLIADYISDGLRPQMTSDDDDALDGRHIRSVIDRWCQHAGRHGLDGSLLVLTSDNRLRLRAIGEVLRARSRTLDYVWLWGGESERRSVLALLPLTSVGSAMALVERVEQEIRARGGTPFEQAGIRVDVIGLTGCDSATEILEDLDRPSLVKRLRSNGLAIAPQMEA